MRQLQLALDFFHGIGGKIFHDADAGLRFEDDDEQAMFIHIDDEEAEFFALLINAVEIGFVDEAGDGLIGQKCAGAQRGDSGQVKIARVALMRDEKSAFVNDERRRRIRRRDKFVERFVETANVAFDKLGQSGHVRRIAGRFG